jgi:RNA polymerase sigma-70 factor (ECF subfamily)
MQKENLKKETIIDAVIKAKQGDNDAFNLIYSELFAPLFRYVYFRVSRREEAEDLAQAAFLKIWSALPDFEITGRGQFISWCFAIARNLVIDFWKKKKETSLEDLRIQPVAEENPEDLIDNREAGELVKKAILSLSDDQQEVIILKFINDLSNKEIAELLSENEEVIRQRQSRALKELRKIINIDKYER